MRPNRPDLPEFEAFVGENALEFPFLPKIFKKCTKVQKVQKVQNGHFREKWKISSRAKVDRSIQKCAAIRDSPKLSGTHHFQGKVDGELSNRTEPSGTGMCGGARREARRDFSQTSQDRALSPGPISSATSAQTGHFKGAGALLAFKWP